jgi:predicted amidohydrolase
MKRCAGFLFSILLPWTALSADSAPGGWSTQSPRPEIRPAFSTGEDGSLVITHDDRQGLDGSYVRTYPVVGGQFYRFQVFRKAHKVSSPRQSCLARISWQDADGKMVKIDSAPEHADPKLPMPSAEPEYPADGATDADGWTLVSGTYKSPSKASHALVELHLQWAPEGSVEWKGAEFAETKDPGPRRVRLATVHYRPTGKSPQENRNEFTALVAEAGKQRADLVVLGETVPSANVKAKPEEIAEPVPGPSTEFFGALAKQHRLHLVLSLYEREAHLIYNTAVLLGPEGQLIGKYRKVSLPPSEAAKGIAPGSDFPVFATAFGKVGLMVCYDGFFPEVARELTKNGAEVIAWPVWGCNPLLAQARACENHVYLVSSTFMDADAGWMLSAIYDHNGQPIAQSGQWGTIALAEVDLNQPYLGPYNLGDFRAMIPRHRPPVEGEIQRVLR